MMKKRQLGQTGIEITPIGLGCWQFANSGSGASRFWDLIPQETINQIIAKSLEGGINWFDTAEAYGKGNSEKALATGLHTLGAKPEEALIATKWWPFFRTAKSIYKLVDERLRFLEGFPITLYQIHSPLSLSSIEAQMMAMVKLLREKKIRAVGVSSFTAAQMRKAHSILQREGYALASNQISYSLLNRSCEKNGVLETAQELGITIIAFSPLYQGLLTGKFHRKEEDIQTRPGPRKYSKAFQESGLKRTAPLIETLTTMAEKHETTPTQVALNWLIHAHGDTVVAIPGASKVHHAEENIKATSFKLSDDEIAHLDKISKEVS